MLSTSVGTWQVEGLLMQVTDGFCILSPAFLLLLGVVDVRVVAKSER